MFYNQEKINKLLFLFETNYICNLIVLQVDVGAFAGLDKCKTIIAPFDKS